VAPGRSLPALSGADGIDPCLEARRRLERQFVSAKAAHEAKRAARSSRQSRRTHSGHAILVRASRSKNPALERESRVYEIMERSPAFQGQHKGGLLSLDWKNLPELLQALIEGPRLVNGEAAALDNAAALFDAMRSKPINNAAESLSALDLTYRVSDLVAQFDDLKAIEKIQAHLRHLLAEIKGHDAEVFCRRMLDDNASLQSDRYGARQRLKFARSAMNRFAAVPGRFVYLSNDFWRLQDGWASTFFNYIQVAMPTARTETRMQGLRAQYDRGLERLGVSSSITHDAATFTAPDP